MDTIMTGVAIGARMGAGDGDESRSGFLTLGVTGQAPLSFAALPYFHPFLMAAFSSASPKASPSIRPSTS
jgi:hypothetical protein